MMVLYKVILSYDGTQFYGSQKQRNLRTVQGVLEQALRKIGWSGTTVRLAGRTDAGVHASGQVAAFDLDWKHPEENLLRALNSLLPEDLAVRMITPAGESFHPRFDAVARRYRYRLLLDPVRNPLAERFAWRITTDLDMTLVDYTAKLLVGMRDFGAFGRPVSEKGTTVREVFRAEWQRAGNRLSFEIVANAFLYHMVRHLVFTQVMVGQGRLTPEQYKYYLEHPDDKPAQGLAPACGLTLEEVLYARKMDGEKKN